MARTTAGLVAGIIDVQEGTDLTPFITTANILVTAVCGLSTYSADQFEIIERWLAAHFYAVFDSQVSYAKAGTAGVKFQEKIDFGLKLTAWGQQAMRLDTDGNLAALDNSSNEKRKVRFGILWMGLPNCVLESLARCED